MKKKRTLGWNKSGYKDEMARIDSLGMDRHGYTQKGIDELSEAKIKDTLRSKLAYRGDLRFWLEIMGINYEYFLRKMEEKRLYL